MTKQPDNIAYVVTDDKGKIHRVKTNIAGEKVRDAYSGGRALAWFICIVTVHSLVKHFITTNEWITLDIVAVVALLLHPLIFKVKIDAEEMKTIRPLAEGEKVS